MSHRRTRQTRAYRPARARRLPPICQVVEEPEAPVEVAQPLTGDELLELERVEKEYDHRAEVLELMETRRTQTNECGRCALIGPALTWAAQQFGGPLALLDVGASAGLNLGCDRYFLDYGDWSPVGRQMRTQEITPGLFAAEVAEVARMADISLKV